MELHCFTLHLQHIQYWHWRRLSRMGKKELGNTSKCKENLFYDKGTFLIIKGSDFMYDI